MKKTIMIIMALVLGTSVFAQIPINKKNDFSSDNEPSEKTLKTKMKSSTADEAVEYSLYLVNYLMGKMKTESTLKYDAFAHGEKRSYTKNGFKIKKACSEVVAQYVVPEANTGNVKAIALIYLYGDFMAYDYSDFATEYDKAIAENYFKQTKNIKNAKANTADDNYYLFQLNQMYGSKEEANKSLQNYFNNIDDEKLMKIRKIIDDKFNEIRKLQVKGGYGDYNYPKSLSSTDITDINETDFSLQFLFQNSNEEWFPLRVCVKSFFGSLMNISADNYLDILRTAIDLKLKDSNPASLAKMLFSIKNGNKESLELKIDYSDPKNQFFATDKKYGHVIFKLLSGVINVDWTDKTLLLKSYYLNRAVEVGGVDAYLNLACLYNYYYKKTSEHKYNDSCMHYIDKAIANNIAGAYTLKGIKVFNGEGYLQNKSIGIDLIIKAKSMGSTSANRLLEELPKAKFSDVREGYYYNPYVKIEYPWDFRVFCSNGCGKKTYPKKIEFGNSYTNDNQISGVSLWVDDFGNPTIYFSETDFQKTFTIVSAGIVNNSYYYFKHTMCSNACQISHENRNNKNFEEIKNKRTAFDSKEIKCAACGKAMKRSDMISVSDCPCIKDDGGSINVSFTESYDIYGDSEPKVCSSECQIKFCKTKCAAHGWSSKY